MAFDFPSSPTAGQQFTPPGGPTYQYESPKWKTVGSVTSGYRNRIINGDFAIDQRNNGGITIAPSGAATYMLDRWHANIGQAPGTLYMYRLASTALLGEYAMIVQPQVADTTIAAGDHYRFSQLIEGNMLRGLNWGNANAKPITISFNCEHNGGPFTLSLTIRNGAGDRCYGTTFTTGTSRIVITVPGDQTGTWLYDNGIGIRLEIGLAIGTTYHTGVLNTWGTSGLGFAGTSNFMASTSNQLYVRNFQLELGSVATEFERVEYSDQLARCQRYYEISLPATHGVAWSGNTANALTYSGYAYFRTAKRANPTVVLTHVSAQGFAATPGTASVNPYTFYESRVSTSAFNGAVFMSSWTASAEL